MLLFEPFAPFDSFFGRTFARPNTFIPYADVTVSDSDLVVTMDLPGLTSDDLEIEVLDGYLHIRGERRRPELAAGTWAHNERPYGRFERRLRLPDGVDTDAITASFEHGVLSLIVPKPERMKPKTISIGSGEARKELAPA